VLIHYCDFASVEVVIKNYLLTYLLHYLVKYNRSIIAIFLMYLSQYHRFAYKR